MLPRLLRGAARVHPARLALVVLSTAMGSGIAVALATVSLQVEDRLGEELRSFGANVVLEPAAPSAPATSPAAATLEERDLQQVLTIFWRYNVVGLAPSLTSAVDVSAGGRNERAVLAGVWFDRALPRPEGGAALRAGIAPLFPNWQLDGRWPKDASAAAVLGHALAARLGVRPGDVVRVATPDGAATSLPVAGVVRTGGFEEEEVLVPLDTAQALTGRPGRISRALVSAITVPLDAFGRRDPAAMTRREYEKWICTPYVTSVARQLQEAVPGSRSRPVWSVAEAEARVLARLDGLVAVLALLTLAAAALAVASTFAARVMGRRVEIALMRACGASAAQVAALLGSEALALGAAGGLLGAALAWALVRGLGIAVFGTPLAAGPGVVPLAVAAALLVAAAGSAFPIRRALALDPAAELKEAA